jgi:hypothetical protein
MPTDKRVAKPAVVANSSDVATTHLARLVQQAMDDQNFSQGDVEHRGGPTKQTLGRVLKHWKGERSLNPETIPQLSRALGLSERSLGRAAAVDMGLLPADEVRGDGLALLADALRDNAGDEDREVVVAAARAVWRVLEDRATRSPVTAFRPTVASKANTVEPRAARTGVNRGLQLREEQDRQGEQPQADGPEHGS